MKKWILFVLLIFTIQLTATNLSLPDNYSKIEMCDCELLEMTIANPVEELIFGENEILINYEGNLLMVYSIEKNQENWTVKAGAYCPRGHRVVCRCGGCAFSSCPYCCSCYSDFNIKKS